jgi:hypothetical protein
VNALVLRLDPQAGAYRPVKGVLRSLRKLRTMEGTAGHMLSGAELVLDLPALAQKNPATLEEFETAVYRKRGEPVDLAYFLIDGIVHPEDFHGVNLLTTYFNLERAQAWFADSEEDYVDVPILYFPRLKESERGSLVERTDNALWIPGLRALAILPFKESEELPQGINAGVVGHEFTHAIFTTKVFPEDTGPTWLQRRALEDPAKFARAMNWTRIFDEALADAFGAFISADPQFMRRSVSAVAEDRRLDPDLPRCLTRELKAAADTADPADFDPYPVAAILSTVAWGGLGSNNALREQSYARSLVAGMTELGLTLEARRERATLDDFAEALAKNIVEDLRPRFCGLLLDRLALTAADVPSCAGAITPERACPR